MSRKKQKIVVFATSFLDAPVRPKPDAGRARQLLEQTAREAGLDLEFRCDRNPATPLEPQELQDVAAVIADLEHYPPELLRAVGARSGGTLQLIARYGIGYSNIDIAAARDCGITVTNTPGASAPPTAEWAVAMMMAVAGRCIPQYERAAAGLTKSGPSRLDLYGATLGIIGTGKIGKKVAELLCSFGMQKLGCDPRPDTDWAQARGVKYTDLDTLCESADIITLHASGSSLIVGDAQIRRMKASAVLVNCARGPMVDNRSAWTAVQEGRLYGYALDEIWEYPDLPLEGRNILVSPHVGSDTDQGKFRMQNMSAEAVAQFFAGKTPINIVPAETNREQF